MKSNHASKEAKWIGSTAFVIGALLFVAGLVFHLADVHIVPNNKALMAMSLIPFSVAFVYFTSHSRMLNSDQRLAKRRIRLTDERLVAAKNQSDALSFKLLQAALFVSYMGYTLFVPDDVFRSVGWWMLMGLLMLSFLAQTVLSKRSCASPETVPPNQ